MEYRCEKCGWKLPDGATFCPGCGEKVKARAIQTCSECHTDTALDSKFCPKCGKKLMAGRWVRWYHLCALVLQLILIFGNIYILFQDYIRTSDGHIGLFGCMWTGFTGLSSCDISHAQGTIRFAGIGVVCLLFFLMIAIFILFKSGGKSRWAIVCDTIILILAIGLFATSLEAKTQIMGSTSEMWKILLLNIVVVICIVCNYVFLRVKNKK